MKRRQRGIAVLIATLILIISAVVYIGYMRTNPPSTRDFIGTGNGVEVTVEIPEGSSISALGPELVKAGVVQTNGAFQIAANNNPDAANVKPGVYRVQKEMSAESAVAALLDPANRVPSLDIPGGATLMDVKVVGGQTRLGIFRQISDATCQEGSKNCIQVTELHRIAGETPPQELGVPEWAVPQVLARGPDPKRLEGLIAPGEYVINPEDDARSLLTRLVSDSAKKYNETGIVERAQSIGLNPYELLSAASLIEREAPKNDFDKVARVILNRLRKPMRLEFDSTVNYDVTEQEIATTDEDRLKVTPWNTYAKDGLPETPIASPSIEAIEAMEHPAEGEWLFFVTVDKDGTTLFNNTFEEHLRDTNQAIDNGVLDSNR
ncbi:putative aminodeoxychorismate lyase [Corynebacterium freiburgense]|nr:putative aminodeoxychorismate lyase [Corynebacterium freiburgense]